MAKNNFILTYLITKNLINMKKRYLFLLTLLLPLATMFSSGRAYAQTDTEYNFALAAIGEYGNYYITTDYAGTKYYLTADGTLTSEQNGAGFFSFTRVTGGAFKTYGYQVDGGEKRFSNPVSDSSINDTQLNATTNQRNDWEAQVFFMNIEGKFGSNYRYQWLELVWPIFLDC